MPIVMLPPSQKKSWSVADAEREELMEYFTINKVNKNNIIRDGNVGNGNSRDKEISPM